MVRFSKTRRNDHFAHVPTFIPFIFIEPTQSLKPNYIASLKVAFLNEPTYLSPSRRLRVRNSRISDISSNFHKFQFHVTFFQFLDIVCRFEISLFPGWILLGWFFERPSNFVHFVQTWAETDNSIVHIRKILTYVQCQGQSVT